MRDSPSPQKNLQSKLHRGGQSMGNTWWGIIIKDTKRDSLREKKLHFKIRNDGGRGKIAKHYI